MKLVINKNQIEGSPEMFLRRAGYAYYWDRNTGKDSFSRRLGSGFYPKLHMYVREQGDKIIFDLHLDQKQASYRGARMHSAEHEGSVVENEIKRLKGLISPTPNPSPVASLAGEGNNNLLKKVGHGELPKELEKAEKKPWWQKLFS